MYLAAIHGFTEADFTDLSDEDCEYFLSLDMYLERESLSSVDQQRKAKSQRPPLLKTELARRKKKLKDIRDQIAEIEQKTINLSLPFNPTRLVAWVEANAELAYQSDLERWFYIPEGIFAAELNTYQITWNDTELIRLSKYVNLAIQKSGDFDDVAALHRLIKIIDWTRKTITRPTLRGPIARTLSNLEWRKAGLTSTINKAKKEPADFESIIADHNDKNEFLYTISWHGMKPKNIEIPNSYNADTLIWLAGNPGQKTLKYLEALISRLASKGMDHLSFKIKRSDSTLRLRVNNENKYIEFPSIFDLHEIMTLLGYGIDGANIDQTAGEIQVSW